MAESQVIFSKSVAKQKCISRTNCLQVEIVKKDANLITIRSLSADFEYNKFRIDTVDKCNIRNFIIGPYQYYLNPVEIMWLLVKAYVTKNDKNI